MRSERPLLHDEAPSAEIEPVMTSEPVNVSGSKVPSKTIWPVAPANLPVPPVIGPVT
jgi:hypothetical protein